MRSVSLVGICVLVVLTLLLTSGCKERPFVPAGDPGTLRWRFQTGGDVTTTPAIAASGVVYFGSFDSCLYALDSSGALKWRYRTGAPIIWSSPALGEDGTVYIGSLDRCLHAVSADGTGRWRYETRGGIFSSPALDEDGTIYITSDDSGLYAINPDGSLKWRTDANSYLSSPAIAKDGTVYVVGRSHLYAVNRDGSLKWKFAVSSDGSPAIGARGTVYVSANADLVAVNPDGTLKWRREMTCTISPTVGPDGAIHVGLEDEYGLCTVDSSGDVTMSALPDEYALSAPAITRSGVVYICGYEYCVLYAVTPDGSVDWTYDVDAVYDLEISPAVAPDGTVYVGSTNGCLYAVYGASPLADAPWPKFQHDEKNTGRVGGGS
jgi:outer membrane protein assembly factor BamB